MVKRALTPFCAAFAFWLGAMGATEALGQTDKKQTSTGSDLAVKLEQLSSQLRLAEDHLRVVETHYANASEPTDEEVLEKKFSDGEIQFLLGEYVNAAVIFYDLISNPRYQSHPRYPDALYYLSDALFQQKNYMGARFYLVQLLQNPGSHQKEALTRFVEISSQLDENVGVEAQVARVEKAWGFLPPEVAYVYGKWMFHRQDLPFQERFTRAQAIFTPLAERPSGPYRLQAGYFLGVGHVKLRQFDEAMAQFSKVLAATPDGPKETQVQELASLSMGRVLYELGRFDEAIDKYQDVPRDSDQFMNAMYEVAWTHVRRSQYQQALNAAEILLLVANNTTLEPDVMLLRAHLLLKLGRYTEASDTYHAVISTFEPVRDEIESLLKIHSDPVKYFDQLLAKSDRQLEVAELLPKVALKWATTEEEVKEAVQMVSDLDASKRGIESAGQIAQRLLALLEERGLEVFPEIQEGYVRADAVESALLRVEQTLVGIEGTLGAQQLTAAEHERLEQLKAQQATLQARFDTLPTNEKELTERRFRMQGKVGELDRDTFKLGYEIQSMFAVVSAIEKWLEDTREEKVRTVAEEKAFIEKLNVEVAELSHLQKDIEALRQKLAEERGSADASLTGEEALRKSMAGLLSEQRTILRAVDMRLSPDMAQLRLKMEALRAQSANIQERTALAKKKLRARVAARAQRMKDIVRAEQALLGTYSQESNAISRDARDVVGHIVVDSFGRVRRQFHQLVLKADVGVVDVAFTRKQDKTAEIQKVSNQKDKELQTLDSEFKEVLEDIE